MWFDVVKTLLSISDKKNQLEQEKRERLSEAFQKMADIVDRVVKELETDTYPLGSCIAMEKLSSDIMSVVSGIMPRDEADALARQLHASSKLELEYAMRKSRDTITNLHRTHGKLIALSIIYSV